MTGTATLTTDAPCGPDLPRSSLAGLLALSTAAFTAVMTELLPAGLLPEMSRALHVSQGRVGFLVTAYAAASFLAAIPLTAALRGLPRRPVLIGALLGFAVCNAVTALSSFYALTLVSRLAAGAMGGLMWAMLVGYAARMVPAERRGRAIAIVLAGITVALSLGVPAGTALAGAFGWRAVFAALAGGGVALVAWVRWSVPGLPGEPAGERVPLRRVATPPGIPSVLVVTLFLLLGHQTMYTYVAPFAERSGFGRTGLILLIFGVATVGGVWLVGVLIDRRLRSTLLCALIAVAAAMLVLGLFGGVSAALPIAVALWGVAFGGAPTLIQTALVNAAGPANADVATSMQTTVYNLGIAAGSLTGGLVLEGAHAGVLPWAALPLVAVALATVALARRHAFPAPVDAGAGRSHGE
ncbi:MFS transporter [Thermomonospora umbrina]|uniref:Putative MFS family arabinose efflux permease n=1 Tax=Thermomonospora umbrina TaxID=111806 RepID=A0A3D9SY29_9ACTN|nr:MFS transporter [Thermomonospora umbrina]REF00857.1 putative MFS family arabinose efflux permease [Thermomonospora umbrina]